MLRIKGISCDGEPGQFRANVNMMGWKSDTTGDAVIHEAKTVQRAEYLEGKLKVAVLEEGEEDETVLGFDGFNNSDYENLAQYFRDYCGVTVKRHYPPEAQVAEPDPEEEDRRPLVNSFGLVNEANCGLLEEDLVEQEDLPAPSAPPASKDEPAGGYSAAPVPTPSLQAAIDAPVPKPQALQKYQCPKCTFINTEYDAKCQMCDEPLPGADTSMWTCHKCTFRNPLTTFACEACGTVRPKSRRAPGSGGGNPNNQITVMNPRKWQGGRSFNSDDAATTRGGAAPAAAPAAAARAAPEGERPEGSRFGYLRRDSILEGWVWKESRFMKRFRKRWMVLTKDTVEWIAKDDDNQGGAVLNVHFIEKMKREKSEATETIQTSDIYNVYEQARPGGRCFCVDASGKTFVMICDDAGDKEEWIRKLKEASRR